MFDPDRPGNQPVSFGLLRRFPKLASAGEPQRRDRFVFRGFARLPVTVQTSKVNVSRLT